MDYCSVCECRVGVFVCCVLVKEGGGHRKVNNVDDIWTVCKGQIGDVMPFLGDPKKGTGREHCRVLVGSPEGEGKEYMKLQD